MPLFVKLRNRYYFNSSKVFAALALAAASCIPVQAQDFNKAPSTWQEHLDLHTSGAAASIVLHLRCADELSQNEALQAVGQRISQIIESLRGLGADEVPARSYANSAYRTKVAAIWQSSSTAQCTELNRLKDLARYLGYPLPR